VDPGRSATYTYDALYRLTSAVTTGSANFPRWGISEVYDRYGNRSDQNQTFGNPPMNHVLIDAVHNRVTGSPYAYDASGNMTNDGANTLTYDGENHAATSVNGGSSGAYTYDGNGLRVKRVSVVSGTTTTTVYLFSGSQVISEYDNGAAPTAPSREYIYSGGALLAKIDSSGAKYYHRDHLSNRLVTDSSGNTVAQLGHYPFGESWYNASNDKLLFTSYERDSESGNDYALARCNISGLGRFASPDPLGGGLSNPQSLNRYAYVLNNPANLVDPLGLAPCNLTISLNGQTLFQGSRDQISDIFKAAGIDISFVDNGQATVNVWQYASLAYLGLGTLGFNPPWQPDAALVDNNAIGRTATAVHGNYDKGLGTVISHEIGHALGLPHGSTGLMRQGTDQGTDAFFMNMGGAQNFTRNEANKIRQKLGCPPLKPKAPTKPASNNVSGGGGGGGSVTGSGGGGGGGGFWIWIPEACVEAGGVKTCEGGYYKYVY
jgi:RHS repeat-associated protein